MFAADELSEVLALRWERYGPQIKAGLSAVYGDRAESLIQTLRERTQAAVRSRPKALKRRDERRLLEPDSLQSERQLSYLAYADRFAGSLKGILEHVDYLTDLGVTNLRLLPFLKTRGAEDDGGFAIQDFRTVDPRLGTVGDLELLTEGLHAAGISLELDLTISHVAREHDWAVRARSGQQRYRDYFLIFPDRELPDRYRATLPDIFPQSAGSFSWDAEMEAWVWTTFHEYQWDLNWRNPNVLLEFVDLLLFFANRGVDAFRLVGLPFAWKRLGTDCIDQPEVHSLTQTLRGVMRIAAPAVGFVVDAPGRPDPNGSYLGVGALHGQIADVTYHPLLTTHLWSNLATEDVRLFVQTLRRIPSKPPNTAWMTSLRTHDEVVWEIDDATAASVGINPYEHRKRLGDWYSGDAEASWARGRVHAFDPVTQQRRISGTTASLAGLEAAMETGDPQLIEQAIARVNLLHALICGFGGVPQIFMGDEIGLLNDYTYTQEPPHAEDTRWVHRPRMDWDWIAGLEAEPDQPGARINAWLRHVVSVRKRTPQLHGRVETELLDCSDRRVLLLRREHPLGPLVEIYNFSGETVTISMTELREGLGQSQTLELLDSIRYDLGWWTLDVAPYKPYWLIAADHNPG